MRKQPSFSRLIPRKGISPGRNRKKSAIYRKTPIFAYKQGGVTVKRTPRKTARRGAVSMLRFDSTYTLTPKTPKIYIALKMHGIFLVFPLFCVIMIIRNIKNTKYCFCVCDTKTTTKNTSKRKDGKSIMKANGIERDFLKEVREARPEDCKTIIAALYSLEGRKDTDGELTSLGMLTGAVIEELAINGYMKMKYGKEGCADV